MTIELLHPDDSGEVTRLPGEDRTVIIRIDTGGEETKNLRAERDAILAATGRMRHHNVVPESLVTDHGYDPEAHSGPIVDLVDTATFHITGDLAGPQKPPPPLPKPKADPAETGVNIFGDLGADLPEQPWPGGQPWPVAARAGARVLRLRAVKAAWWRGLWTGLAIGVGVGFAVYAGQVLAAGVVIW